MGNPLTQLTGPEFLLVFAVLIVAVAAFGWYRRRDQDKSRALPRLEPPNQVDPYQIAYLRAGANELARVLIVGLLERKYFQITKRNTNWWSSFVADQVIERAPGHPDTADLSPIERDTFKWFETSRTAQEVFGSKRGRVGADLPTALLIHTARYEQSLQSQQLLASEELRSEARWNISLGIAVVAMIGLARLFIGISRGRPVGFLVLMGIAGVFVIARAGRPLRLSWRGQTYLEAAKTRWQWMRNSKGQDWSPSLAAGLFGYAVLAGTEMSPLNDMFRRTSPGGYLSGSDGGGCGGGGG